MEINQHPPEHDHLRLLGIFYYIVGGLGALFSLFPLIYVILGIIVLISPETFNEEMNFDHDNATAIMGWGFMGFGLALMLFSFLVSGLTIYAGNCFRSQKHYTFCMVISCLLCLNFPLGTLLGIFSIVVLTKEESKYLFEERKRVNNLTA